MVSKYYFAFLLIITISLQKLRLFVGEIFDSQDKQNEVDLAKEEINSLGRESKKLEGMLAAHVAFQYFVFCCCLNRNIYL